MACTAISRTLAGEDLMVETDAERMYVKLQKRQGRTDQPHYVEVRMLEFVGGAVLVGNPPLEEVRRIQPFGPLVDQSGRAA